MLAADALLRILLQSGVSLRCPARSAAQEALPMDAYLLVAVYGKLVFKMILGNCATKLPLAYGQRRSCLCVSLRKVNVL